MRVNLFFGFFLMAFIGIFMATVAEAVAKGCMNGGCHQELVKVKYMHGPVAAEMAGVNGCEMCHAPAGAKCSEGRAGSYKIKTRGLCVTCHARGTGTKHSDKEIEGKCLQCHDPHGSEVSRYMLRAGRK
ncbi:MAG: hypothetical protein KAS94_02505 [Desulfobulbaceae bacterium]|nr:hypothetical protein [Desulfobulbaceae bacterium]